MKGKLTLDHNILTGLLVTLASATHPVRETIALVSEGLTLLTHQDAHCQLVLDQKDQQVANAKRKERLTLTYIFHPRWVAPVPTHNPLS